MRTLIFFLLIGAACGARAQGVRTNGPSLLLAFEGKVEVARAGAAAWSAGTTNLSLANGDRVRTGMRSRATIQLSDRSILRVNELTTLEIRPPQSAGANSSFELKSGASYFFNRERPGAVEFRTPVASGAIRGTEFHLLVLENGRTELALLDGLVDLSNDLGTANLASGEQAVVDPGQPPRKTAMLDASSIIQWALYYPAIVDMDELGLADAEKNALADSLAAYRAGDLIAAQSTYPDARQPASDAEKTYRAATLLAVGQVATATQLVQNVSSPVADALRQMVSTVQGRPASRGTNLTLASEWMAESYALQAQSKVPEALVAAKMAARKSPGFGFALTRQAELEFGFGNVGGANQLLDRSLSISPRNAHAHALRGFALAARSQFQAAEESFDRAIALDPALANGWLGRGLVRIRRAPLWWMYSDARTAEGRQDLQVAATLEPKRSILRSYLGKAWSETRDAQLAEKELRLAQKLDANDPTPWLYSAILAEQQNKVNEAIRELERSQELNDNRSVFRSRLLLDQDKAVRSANLARIYQDAGMTDWAVREASRAVSYDYANFSAHQFLANSYEALRDPKQINLRYEAPAVSEYFIANLLAPVGAIPLSATVSQQEYTRLFERSHVGVASSTEYFSNGDWIQHGVQYGRAGTTDWALEAYYRTENGQRFNNDLERTDYRVTVRQKITDKDTVLLQGEWRESEGGDLFQYYSQEPRKTGVIWNGDPGIGFSPGLRFEEEHKPNVFLGFHREWAPGHHTLLFGSRLDDELRYKDPSAAMLFFRETNGQVASVRNAPNAVGYKTELEAYSAELQQIFTLGKHTFVAGGRFQYGTSDTFNSVSNIARINVAYDNHTHIQRETVYVYDQWMLLPNLQLIGGLAYDWLLYPDNIDSAPITSTQNRKDQISPKIGALWSITDNTYARVAYTRSLGGVFSDTSIRLEPTQIGGFNQVFRSIAPESSVGLVPGTRFETFGLGLGRKFPTHTYLDIDGQWLQSKGTRTVGIITNSVFIPVPDSVGSAEQRIRFEEQTLTVSVNQLLGENWSVGTRYRVSHADLKAAYPRIRPAVNRVDPVNRNEEAILHQISLTALYNLPCGFFAQAEAQWTGQDNDGYSPALNGDDLWQFHVFAGYRFWRRHAEARVGVLNITDQDYKLNPLTLYNELPRERTFYASFRFYF